MFDCFSSRSVYTGLFIIQTLISIVIDRLYFQAEIVKESLSPDALKERSKIHFFAEKDTNVLAIKILSVNDPC